MITVLDGVGVTLDDVDEELLTEDVDDTLEVRGVVRTEDEVDDGL